MKIITQILVGGLTGSLTCCVMAISLSFANPEDEIKSAAEKGHPLTAKEVNSIYADKTWFWEDGAGYFGTSHRVFKAASGKAGTATYGNGSWSADDQGRLCFNATWYSLGGHSTASVCFEHRSDDQNIYQRKLLDGKWYVFSHLPSLPDDEIKKLQPGDHVSEEYEANKRYLAEHPIATAAKKGRVLTAKELDSIYGDRTWIWPDGEGYFAMNNRGFKAASGKDAKASYADGFWTATDKGRLCFQATWYGVSGHRTSRTCFDHRSDEQNIYQRKLPGGTWAVFSHLPAQPDDGIQKLLIGDHVSDYEENKRYVIEHARRRKKK